MMREAVALEAAAHERRQRAPPLLSSLRHFAGLPSHAIRVVDSRYYSYAAAIRFCVKAGSA